MMSPGVEGPSSIKDNIIRGTTKIEISTPNVAYKPCVITPIPPFELDISIVKILQEEYKTLPIS